MAYEQALTVITRARFSLWRWTYRLRWWSPEAKADRARRRYGECVYCVLVLTGVRDEAVIEELIQRAFLALHREYVAGRSVADPRRFAIEHARKNCARV